MEKSHDVSLESYAKYIKNFYTQKEIREYFDDYFSKLNHLRGHVILDNGCGIGSSTKRLLEKGNRVISLEYNPYLLKYAYEKRVVNEPVLGDSQYLPIRSNSVDAVIFHDVIEHLLHPTQALEEICRILKPKGRLYLTTPNGFWSRLYLKVFPDTEPDDPTHIHEFNWGELKGELTRSGFKIVNASASSLPLVNKISTRLSRRLARFFRKTVIYIACPGFWITAEKL